MYTRTQQQSQTHNEAMRKPASRTPSMPSAGLPNSILLSLLENTDTPASLPNKTGLPDALKARFERKSGIPLDDVRVYRNSDKPAELGALAYAKGNEIHLGPGQEEHLEHELGHVVQQKQGLVQPTGIVNGLLINEDVRLEHDTDNAYYKKLNGNIHLTTQKNNMVPKTIQMMRRAGGKLAAQPQHRRRAVRIRWNTQIDFGFIEPLKSEVERLFSGIDLQDYTMNGAQSAKTSLLGENFITTDNMHSEMCALNHGLETGALQITQDGQVQWEDPTTIMGFETTQPHCRFCTFFLHILGLPLTTPTSGNFNYASHLNYPLPDQIKQSADVINRILGLSGLNIEDHILPRLVSNYNELTPEQKTEVYREFLGNRSNCFDMFWREVFAAIREADI